MTKKYSVTPFNKIENKAPANIVFTQGNATKVEADGPDNYIPQLIVMVKDSTLSISMDKDNVGRCFVLYLIERSYAIFFGHFTLAGFRA
jgi:hypothetical protein